MSAPDHAPGALSEVDPFDLPEWLGEHDVTWSAGSGLRTGHRVSGLLAGDGEQEQHPCDLLAVDEAYPRPVLDDQSRSRAHLAWRHGQVLLLADEVSPLTLAVPGTAVDADLALDALSRLAKAVGASPEHYSVLLRIGRDAGPGRG
ncbi:hypothetical protein NOK12_26720 [Nocardioides sp. OK12]|uniref:Uncharacterized protein n=1 Tax=Nocardioides marinisabuli TaxID=419476 RepID=A0A7Y9F3P4_9ACTN|nr:MULTISPECIES: hypothetical protein [Nocardioides]NYD59039.1 hypothetical protein [Nocardioides marinisabuli]GHJ60154.1 hypothetical protein NOK12_26720 [Nocardioides sp. OK12]